MLKSTSGRFADSTAIDEPFPARVPAGGRGPGRQHDGRRAEHDARAALAQLPVVQEDVHRPRLGRRVFDMQRVFAGFDLVGFAGVVLGDLDVFALHRHRNRRVVDLDDDRAVVGLDVEDDRGQRHE